MALCLPAMKPSEREPSFTRTEEEAAAKSPLARAFIETRKKLNEKVTAADNAYVKRFYALDHNAYLEGPLPAKTKELMGLAVSAALRCDDCINYHIIQSWRLDATRAEQEDTINVAMIIGGSIVIPHMRRAYAMLDELYAS